MVWALGLWGLWLVTAGWAAPADRAVLPSGMTVIAVQDRTAPVAAFHLGVRFDPLAIERSQAGVAAVVGQALQQELQARLRGEGWRELAEEVRGRGSLSLNTESDYWEVRCQVTTRQFESALRLTGELLFGEPALSETVIQESRRVLVASLEERSERVVENTYFRFLQAYYGRLSPLAQPVYGNSQSLEGLQAAQVQAFGHAQLTPDRAALCIIGPQVPAETIALVRRMYGEYSPPAAGPRPALPALPTESRISVAQLPDWRAASVMIGVPVPDYGTRGFIIAQLMFSLLAGEQGRLERDPQLRGGLGLNRLISRPTEQSGVTVMAPMAVPQPFIAVHLVSLPRLMEQGRQVVLGHLLGLAHQPPEAAEYQGAVDRLLNTYAQSQLQRMSLAKNINCYELYGGDYKLALNFPAVVRSLTPAEVQAVAREHFTRHAIGVILPGETSD
jgi:predicted Zn-dependent peptidase